MCRFLGWKGGDHSTANKVGVKWAEKINKVTRIQPLRKTRRVAETASEASEASHPSQPAPIIRGGSPTRQAREWKWVRDIFTRETARKDGKRKRREE